MTTAEMIGTLTYFSYAENRRRAPEISVTSWAKIYGPKAHAYEARLQAEQLVAERHGEPYQADLACPCGAVVCPHDYPEDMDV